MTPLILSNGLPLQCVNRDAFKRPIMWRGTFGPVTIEAALLGTLKPVHMLELTHGERVFTERGRDWNEACHRLFTRGIPYGASVAIAEALCSKGVAA